MNSQIKHQLQIQLQSNQDHQQQFIKSQISQVQQPQEQQIKSLSNIKSFNYQIINHNYIQQQEYCNLVAFNKDGSILAVGCDNLINLYEFSQGMLKYNQSLNDHQDTVNTLYFMRQSNQIISGDQNGYI
ncbi:unnamed protein product [Paramecium pentaurelia]|uniref:WD40-repeat-containing domain n=1 Tax=Paramecium pentaurelia TaxID=43138 RepID=A0A8S1XR81_9CILI|nr:unnamed protein product [Paramecium pentaurelia]